MTAEPRWATAGRIGRPHGLDGSFHVEHASHPLPEGAQIRIGEREAKVERRAGSGDRPLVRIAGVGDRDAAGALRGQTLLVLDEERLNYWIERGAQPTNTVRKLMRASKGAGASAS